MDQNKINHSIRQAFGETLYNLGRLNPKIFVVDMDLKSSLFLDQFAADFPDRFIECGVAETNAAGIAAGLAKIGKTVFLTSFACFSPAINWNTVKQSICYNNANVKIVGSHAGLMSTDLGATHQMLEDIALMRSLPNMEVFAPIDAIETEKIIRTLTHSPAPAYIRLVRPPTEILFDKKMGFTIGKSNILKKGKNLTIIGYGPILNLAFQAAKTSEDKKKNISIEIINCSSIKPLDTTTIIKSIKKTKNLIVLEDHQKQGGLGEAVASLVLANNIACHFTHLAVDDRFGESAKTVDELYSHFGISLNHLLEAIDKLL